MLADPWLKRWLPLLVGSCRAKFVLEIGCGEGQDTEALVGAGLRVHAFDLSTTGVAKARSRAPSATIFCGDVRSPLPVLPGPVGAVVASLSLHYFGWAQTVDVFERIRLRLEPGGLFLCRLNSTDDHNFGASGHPELEPSYFLVDGQPKRFFDKASVDALTRAGWTTLFREHRLTHKYVEQKAVWELVLQRADV